VALAVCVLAGAGLLLRSFQEVGRVSPGFDPEHVLTLDVTASYGETGDPKAANQRMNRIVNALNAIPGLESAAASFWLPGVATTLPVEFKSQEGPAESEPKIMTEFRGVSPGYFATGASRCSPARCAATIPANR